MINKNNKKWRAPTEIKRIGEKIYLVDCWRGEIWQWVGGTSQELIKLKVCQNSKNWKRILKGLKEPHSLASDGKITVIDEAGRNMLRVIKNKYLDKKNLFNLNKFYLQKISLSGKRPHRTKYLTKHQMFVTLTACDQKLLWFKNEKNCLIKKGESNLDFLKKRYCRSFSYNPEREEIWLVAGSDDWSDKNPVYKPEGAVISQATLEWENSYLPPKIILKKQYPIPKNLANMNDIYWRNNEAIISSTPSGMAKIINIENKEEKENIKIKNLYKKLNLSGTPYYLDYWEEEKTWVIPEIGLVGKINFLLDKNCTIL